MMPTKPSFRQRLRNLSLGTTIRAVKRPFRRKPPTDQPGQETPARGEAGHPHNLPTHPASSCSSFETKEEEESVAAEMKVVMGLGEQLDHILGLLDVERWLAAYDMLGHLKREVEEGLEKGDPEAERVQDAMTEEGSFLSKRLAQLEKRGLQCKRLLETDASADDSGWTLCSVHNGTKTYCQDAGDGKSIRVLLDGPLPSSPLEQMAVIRESQLYTKWMPLCRESYILDRQGLVDQIFYIRLLAGVIGLDLLLNGWGCDALMEDNAVLVLADSVEAPLERAPHAPVKGDSLTLWRVSLRDVQFKFKVTAPDSTHCVATFVVDPHITGLNSIINWAITKVAGRLLDFICHQARQVVLKGKEGSYLAQAMLSESYFYRDFVAPRVWWVCCRVAGGSTPPPKVFSVLGITTEEAAALNPYIKHHHSNTTATNNNNTATTTTAAADTIDSSTSSSSTTTTATTTTDNEQQPRESPPTTTTTTTTTTCNHDHHHPPTITTHHHHHHPQTSSSLGGLLHLHHYYYRSPRGVLVLAIISALVGFFAAQAYVMDATTTAMML